MRSRLLCLLIFLAACTGSSEPEKDYQLVFGVSQASATGVLAGCTGAFGATGGLVRIDSRKLGGSPGQCNFVPTASPPFDLERRIQQANASDTSALYISLPKAGLVQAFDNQLGSVVWAYPSAAVLLPTGQDFCPTKITLSSGQLALTNSPSENYLVILDDPSNPSSGCPATTRASRVVVLNRTTGTRLGWLNLDFAARANGQIRLAATDSELFILYADSGTSYRVARILFSSISENTLSSSLLFSEPVPSIFSAPDTQIWLGFGNTNGNSAVLLAAFGGSSGKVILVGLNATTNRPEFGAELRETADTSSPLGSSNRIFWNRDASSSSNFGAGNITLFARERPDTVLRRQNGLLAQVVSRGLTTTDGVFSNNGNFWGLSNNAFYRLDVFYYPNIQTALGLTNLGDAQLTAISWLISN